MLDRLPNLFSVAWFHAYNIKTQIQLNEFYPNTLNYMLRYVPVDRDIVLNMVDNLDKNGVVFPSIESRSRKTSIYCDNWLGWA